MRKYYLIGILLLCLLQTGLVQAQDFSNKGQDFWVGYGYHERMQSGAGGSQSMVLYFATEEATNVTVAIPGTGYSQGYSIPANTIFTSNPIPKTGAQDARLNTEGVSNRGIHITSDKPIVAYAHIYNESVSGATLLFPTNTLGKDYYSINYEQLSNSTNANCWFYAIAVDPGTTTVEITPSQPTLDHPAGVPFTVDLTQGQVINMMGVLGGQSGDLFRGVDLTGSRIRTISNDAGGCKRIAVFSGSGRIALVCDGNGSGQKSSDNYMVQAFPKTAWGKNYLTVPTQLLENNVFRIAVDDPTTEVRMNGTLLSGLINGFYYEVGPLNTPTRIEADKPIMVAQYISTGRYCNNGRVGDLGDPEVIYLSPIEQTINRVILNSTSNFAIRRHFINVTIPNTGEAINSFRLDGAAVTGFKVHPQQASYSYAQFEVNAGQHTLQSDSGFNAVAYGYGDFESYGYNAGANVRDLYQFLSITNDYTTVDFPAACKGAPFSLSMTFPYQPTQISWEFNGLFPDVVQNNPAFTSTSVVNGRTLYKYTLPGNFNTNTPGTYPIRILAQNPTGDGCNGLQEKNYDLEVFESPVADFDFSTSGCVSSPVSFTDNSSNGNGRAITQWYWDFGDGNSASTAAPLEHTYTGPGSYDVKYSLVTDLGCKSAEVTKTVVLNDPPVASFTVATASCAGETIHFTDASQSPPATTLGKWYWNFGDGSPEVVALNNAPQTHTYATTGTYPVTLQVETVSGCVSTVFSSDLVVHPNPVADFTLPEQVCVSDQAGPFADASTVTGGTISSWEWNFGDVNATPLNPDIATTQQASHQYTIPGTYTAQLIAGSDAGCKDTLTKTLNVNGAVLTPFFSIENTAAICSGQEVLIKDASQIDAGNIIRLEIFWDADDVSIRTTDTDPAPGKIYSHRYPAFGTPASRSYRIRYEVYSGITCVNSFEKEVTLLATPVLSFDAALPICSNAPAFPLNVQLQNNLDGSGVFSGAGVNTTGLFDPAVAGAGNHTIVYTYTASNGCSDAVTKVLQVNPTPLADAGPDKVLLEGGRVMLTPALITDIPVTYTWTPADWLSDPAIANAEASPPADTRYKLVVSSDQGCSTGDEVFVKLLKTPVIPNIFSPNGDGIHDRWVIEYLESYPGCIVQIFNRYGQMVYKIVNYTTPWDGRINGKDAPIGTYYYIIDPRNGRKPMTGFVDIIR